MDQNTLYNGIVNIVGDAISLLSHHAGEVYAQSVKIVWNKRMRSTAGRAFLYEAKVELNPKLLELGEPALSQVRQTLLHELAHLLAHHRHGRGIAPHGGEWQQACTDLGIPGESATHQLPLPLRKQRKQWRYTCPNCLKAIDRVRRMKRHSACYPCCKKYAKGNYNEHFQFIEQQL